MLNIIIIKPASAKLNLIFVCTCTLKDFVHRIETNYMEVSKSQQQPLFPHGLLESKAPVSQLVNADDT